MSLSKDAIRCADTGFLVKFEQHNMEPGDMQFLKRITLECIDVARYTDQVEKQQFQKRHIPKGYCDVPFER